MKQFSLYIFIVFLFATCKKDSDVTTKIINLETFNQIDLNDTFEVFLVEDSAYKIEVIGDKEFVDYVECKVENKILSVANTKKRKWLSPTKNKIKLKITSHPLKRIHAAEGCNIKTLNTITSHEFGIILTGKSNQANLQLDVKSFYYWNNFPSGGKLTLSGKADFSNIWNFAIMTVDAQNLISYNANVDNNSKGDCILTVTNKFEYSIKGNGNILLYGKPGTIVEKSVTSSGKLIQY